ncbi:hypothetical protein DICA4_E02014 [Diutina catenulata]
MKVSTLAPAAAAYLLLSANGLPILDWRRGFRDSGGSDSGSSLSGASTTESGFGSTPSSGGRGSSGSGKGSGFGLHSGKGSKPSEYGGGSGSDVGSGSGNSEEQDDSSADSGLETSSGMGSSSGKGSSQGKGKGSSQGGSGGFGKGQGQGQGSGQSDSQGQGQGQGSGNSSSSTELEGSFTGQATYFTDSIGACGNSLEPNSEYFVAISQTLWNQLAGEGDTNSAWMCNDYWIDVSCNGKSVSVKLEDLCESCGENDVDLSQKAFSDLAELDVGVLDVTWSWSTQGGGSTSGSGAASPVSGEDTSMETPSSDSSMENMERELEDAAGTNVEVEEPMPSTNPVDEGSMGTGGGFKKGGHRGHSKGNSSEVIGSGNSTAGHQNGQGAGTSLEPGTNGFARKQSTGGSQASTVPMDITGMEGMGGSTSGEAASGQQGGGSSGNAGGITNETGETENEEAAGGFGSSDGSSSGSGDFGSSGGSSSGSSGSSGGSPGGLTGSSGGSSGDSSGDSSGGSTGDSFDNATGDSTDISTGESSDSFTEGSPGGSSESSGTTNASGESEDCHGDSETGDFQDSDSEESGAPTDSIPELDATETSTPDPQVSAALYEGA